MWCSNTNDLTKVKISPSNKHFKYLETDNQIIVGKSDPKEEVFDTIIFANRDIKTVTIPKHIKYIKKYSFENCQNLEKIEFAKDSELISIGFYSFLSTAIKEIIIPKSVSKIENGAFFLCKKLKKFSLEKGSKLLFFDDYTFFLCDELNEIDIPEDSSLQSIYESAFNFTGIKSIYIPSTVDEIEERCFCYMKEIQNVNLSPFNKHFKYLDDKNQIIVGKSDIYIDIFDTIIFANRDIKHATIPNYIKIIYSSAFQDCKLLKTIDIPDDSQIEKIGDNAFSYTSLVNFKVPRKITKYENEFLKGNKDLIYFEFLGDCFVDDKHNSILYGHSKLKLVSFPNVKKLSFSVQHYNWPSNYDIKLLVSPHTVVSLFIDDS